MLIMLSFLYPCLNTTKFVAIEKEKQLKEAMKIMGLSSWLHWTGWFVRTMFLFTISISLMTIVFKVYYARCVRACKFPRYLFDKFLQAPWYTNVDVSILSASDWTTIWVFLFVYCISTTMFSFMLSVFFSKANTAAAMAGLVWFIFYAVYMFSAERYEELTLESKLVMSIFSNTAMAFGFQLIVRFEGTGEGLQWNNMWRPVSVDDDLTVGYLIVMLLLDATLYLLVALYVEQIYPGDYGIAKPWYFPVGMCFHSGDQWQDDDGQASIESENFENDPVSKKAGIRIRNMRKVYRNGKVAVEGLTMNMFNGQITVLLGHNGAGKTTTMAMLCGMFAPSSGTAIVNGRNIRTDIEAVRHSLGLCPQHNILFDELTVREHIEFFGRLKGLDRQAIRLEVDKYVRLIGLESKKDATAATLSGGMKRKLSVCVAFCGGSKVVLCDEPTSGMDPASRRSLWDVLKAEKAGRTVLLSTHFMDEADVLGDRIAIMANGKLKCTGSSYFLKKRFGVGYHLICVKMVRCNTNTVTELLQKYIPDIAIETDIGTELSYMLPESSGHLLSALFDELERKMSSLYIDSFGVALTTLEEVFMKVGSDSVVPNHCSATGSNNNHNQTNGGLDHESSPNCYANDVRLVTGIARICNQIIAMFWKKYLQTVRNWILLLLQIAIPIVFLVITLLALRQGELTSNLPALPITIDTYKDSITILETGPQFSSSLASA